MVAWWIEEDNRYFKNGMKSLKGLVYLGLSKLFYMCWAAAEDAARK